MNPSTQSPGAPGAPVPEDYTLLSGLAPHPMPEWARGALVSHAPAEASAPVPAAWLPHGGGVPDGSVLLSWYPTCNGTTDASAHLGLANGEVLLALWPNLCGDWARVVRPTLREVLGLHAAMTLAKDALCLANHLLDSR